MSLLDLPQPFLPEDAYRVGLTRSDLAAMARTGIVRRVLRGVYADARLPDSLELRAAALARVVPDGAVVCRGTAAWFYAVDVLPPGSHLVTPPVELVVPEGNVVPQRAGSLSYSAQIASRDIEVVHGIAVVSPLRTTCDLARYRPRPDAVAAVDAMTHSGIVKLNEVIEELSRWRGERNIARAHEVVSLAEPKTESPGESRLRLRVVDAGFPRPEAQLEFFEDGVLVYRLDLGLRELKRGIEYDGEQHEAQSAYDEARREWFRRRGWEILSAGQGEVFRNDFALELAVGELLGMTPIRRRPVPGWG